LSEEIDPTLEKLRGERKAYLEWSKNEAEVERTRRFVIAHEYVTAIQAHDAARVAHAQAKDAADTLAEAIARLKKELAVRERELKAKETERMATMSTEVKKVTAEEEAAGKALAHDQAAVDSATKTVKEEERAHAAAAKALADCERSIATLSTSLMTAEAAAKAAKAKASETAATVAALQAKLQAVTAGMDVDAGGASVGTLSDQILAAKGAVTSINTAMAGSEMKVKHLRGMQKDLERACKSATSDHAALEAQVARAAAAVDGKRATLSGMKFNPVEEEANRAAREAAAAEIATLGDKLDSERSRLAPLLEFHYDTAGMGGGWDTRRVKGPLARLFTVTRPEAAYALEIAAGGKLFQVVVDTELTGKALLERGKLRTRTTLIPLNKVRRSTIPAAKVALAATVSKGTAMVALDAVAFPEDVRAAMEYAFGSFFIVPDAATAKAVTFHAGIQVPCVTLDGDLFDPQGTLEGGSKADGAAATPILMRVAAFQAAAGKVEALKAQIVDLDAKLAATAKAAAAFSALSSEIEVASHEVSLLQQRLANSALSTARNRQAAAEAEVAKEEAALEEGKAALKAALSRVRELEAQVANAAKARETRVAAVEKELSVARRAAHMDDATAKQLTTTADATRCDLDAANKELITLRPAATAAESALTKARDECDTKAAKRDKTQARYDEAKAALDKAREKLAATDAAVKALVKERDNTARELESSETQAKAADGKAKTAAKDMSAAMKVVTDLARAHDFIEADKAFFGREHSDYDFARFDVKEQATKLAALVKRQEEIGRRVNKKVMGMIEAAERECSDLQAKKTIIENDKAKIQVRAATRTRPHSRGRACGRVGGLGKLCDRFRNPPPPLLPPPRRRCAARHQRVG